MPPGKSFVSDAITRLNAALVGRYRIDRDVGEGGMAMVYLADDVSSGNFPLDKCKVTGDTTG